MSSPVLLSPLCLLSLSQLLPLKALQSHLPHTSEWDVLQLLTGPTFPPLPTQAKKTPPGQKPWDVSKEKEEENLGFKHRGWVCRADISRELLVSGSGKAVKARAGGAFAGVGLSCRAVGSEAPTHPHCPLAIYSLPLAPSAGT